MTQKEENSKLLKAMNSTSGATAEEVSTLSRELVTARGQLQQKDARINDLNATLQQLRTQYEVGQFRSFVLFPISVSLSLFS